MSSDSVVVASDEPSVWRYEVPKRTDADMQLLTIGAVAVRGHWYGAYGQHFVAWCQLPKRDKAREKELGVLQ